MIPEPATTPPRVAIIGAGFSGVMLAANLVRLLDDPQSNRAVAPNPRVEIVLFDRSGRTGRGPAYSTTDPAHLLNVPAVRMGAWADDPADFHNWLTANGHTFAPAAFVPRRLYAEYLDDQWRTASRTAARLGALLRVEPHDVLALARGPSPDRFTLRFQGGSLDAHAVALSTGHLEPVSHHAPQAGRVIANPWRTSGPTPAHIAPGEHVLIAGSGLTMLDVVLSLLAGPWAVPDTGGRITCVSRHALMPRPHRADPLSPAPPSCTLDPAAAARELASPLRALRWVRRAAAASPEPHAWTYAVDALRPHTHAAWSAWSTDQRRQFLRHLRALWDVHRHRVDPAVLDRVHALRAAGRFELRAAALQSWQESDHAVEVTLRPRFAGQAERLTCDRLVLCTGPNPDIARSRDPLMASLLREGLVQRDALGLGILCEPGPEGRVKPPGNAPSHPAPLYAVGPLRRADLWESIAVPELRVQAAATARAVIDQIVKARARERS